MSGAPDDMEMVSVTLPRDSWRGIQAGLLELCRLWSGGVVSFGDDTEIGAEWLRVTLPVISVAAACPEFAEFENSVRERYGIPVPENVLAVARGVVKEIPGDYWQGEGV